MASSSKRPCPYNRLTPFQALLVAVAWREGSQVVILSESLGQGHGGAGGAVPEGVRARGGAAGLTVCEDDGF